MYGWWLCLMVLISGTAGTKLTCFYFQTIHLFVGLSFNQPKFCLNATWNANGTTFADNSTIGESPKNIFINTNNTIYAVNSQTGRIQMWLNGSSSPTGTITSNSSDPFGLFVSSIGDIYVENSGTVYQVDVWRENNSSRLSALYVDGYCYSMFIDSNDTLYCSLRASHKVIKRSLDSSDYQVKLVAGTGCAGCQPHTFNYPCGIFLTINFDLYVADGNNHRIQFFQSGQVNGTTAVGKAAPGTMLLRFPRAVTLDADGYLFIVDKDNNRIIGSGPDGFRCVIGCTSQLGSAADQLSYPLSMAFDSHGNIFVADTDNSRVQKFVLSSNFCSK